MDIVKPQMVKITGGQFTMGVPENEPHRTKYEGPCHQVKIDTFYLGKYAVTQKEYNALMGDFHSTWTNENYPVDQVNWYDAVEYCNRLSKVLGLQPVYTIKGLDVTCDWSLNGYRLPTEAEWEYACRAGTTTPYYFGNGPATAQDGNFGQNQITGKPKEVGSYPPNPWGLYEMGGNMYEWCWDWWANNYSMDWNDNPKGPDTAETKVLRGGCYFLEEFLMRSGRRDDGYQSRRSVANGFRLAQNA